MLQYGKLSNKNEIYLLRSAVSFDIFQLFSGQFDGLNQMQILTRHGHSRAPTKSQENQPTNRLDTQSLYLLLIYMGFSTAPSPICYGKFSGHFEQILLLPQFYNMWTPTGLPVFLISNSKCPENQPNFDKNRKNLVNWKQNFFYFFCFHHFIPRSSY